MWYIDATSDFSACGQIRAPGKEVSGQRAFAEAEEVTNCRGAFTKGAPGKETWKLRGAPEERASGRKHGSPPKAGNQGGSANEQEGRADRYRPARADIGCGACAAAIRGCQARPLGIRCDRQAPGRRDRCGLSRRVFPREPQSQPLRVRPGDVPH